MGIKQNNREVLSAKIMSLSDKKLIAEFILDVSTNEELITFSYTRNGKTVFMNSLDNKQKLFFSIIISGELSDENIREEIKEKFPPPSLMVLVS